MILVGNILKVRGNKGEVVYASPDALHYPLEKGENVCLKSKKYQKEFQIEYLKESKSGTFLKFKGVDTINEAFRLIGYSIFKLITPEEAGIETPNDTIDDFVVKDLNGQVWGTVVDINVASLNKLIEVQDGEKSYFVPFVDEIVKEINREKREILIDPPPGLKEL